MQICNSYCKTRVLAGLLYQNNNCKGGEGRAIPPLLDNVVTTDLEKANLMASSFASVSSIDNYHPDFIVHKNGFEATHMNSINTIEESDSPLNSLFNFKEFTDALDQTYDTSPGEDTVTYSMYKQMTDQTKDVILSFINSIWEERKLPPIWKHAVIKPIFKNGKDPSMPLSYRPNSLTSSRVK